MTTLELLIKKHALKEVELWLHQQYAEIDKEMQKLEAEDKDDDMWPEGGE